MARPLVYYAVTIFMGCITCLILINNPIVGAIITALFLSIMYFTIDKKFFYLVFCFFIISNINYYSYFNVNLPSDVKIKVRISDKSTYYCSARYNDKKIDLKGNIFEFSEGRNVDRKSVV